MTIIVIFRSLFCKFRNTIIVNRQFVATKPGFNRCVLFNRHHVVQEVATGIPRCSFFSTSNTSGNNINNNNSGNFNVTTSKDLDTASITSIFVTPRTNDYNNSTSDTKSDASSSYGGNTINVNNEDKNSTASTASDSYAGSVCSVGNHSKSLDGITELRSVYIHPLSQIVLEYLQDCRHEWIIEKGLDRSLTLHRDGSFEVKGSLSSVCTNTASDLDPNGNVIVRQQKNFDGKNNDMNNKNDDGNNDDKRRNTKTTKSISIIDENEEIKAKSTTNKSDSLSSTITSTCHVEATTAANQQQHNIQVDDNIRIWTSYDEQEKKHWLTVRKGLFRQRFLLNLLSAWNGNRGMSLNERIHVTVDGMIRAVDRLEGSSQTTTQIEFPRQRLNRKIIR